MDRTRSREDHQKLCEVASLVETVLGLSLLSQLNITSPIPDAKDCQIAADSSPFAIAPLMREARKLLNEVL
jgi:hypothetical protein